MATSLRLIFVILVLMIIHGTAFAQEEALKIEKLAQDSELILTGKVIHKESSWNASKTRIYTRTTLQVEERLKGTDNQKSVEITTLGGEVGDVGEIYSHMPRFDENEEVLVFLKKDEDNKSYHVMHGKDGKIRLLSDIKTRKKVTGSNTKLEVLKSKIQGYLHVK